MVACTYSYCICVTGFAKTVPKGTRGEIQITDIHTLKLRTLRHYPDMPSIWLYRWPDLLLQAAFANPVNSRGCCFYDCQLLEAQHCCTCDGLSQWKV